MKVRQFADGSVVAQALLVREVELRRARDGSEYLKLQLGDATGTVPALVSEDVPSVRGFSRLGEAVFVTGRVAGDGRFGPQLAVESIRPARDGEFHLEDLLDGPSRDAGQMEADLRELLATIQNPHLRRLLTVVFGEESVTWASYRDAPAAKRDGAASNPQRWLQQPDDRGAGQ